jgi:WD40 repeat protein
MVVAAGVVMALGQGLAAGGASATATATLGTITFDRGTRPDTSSAFTRSGPTVDVLSTTILSDGSLDLSDSASQHLRIRLGDGSALQPHTTYTLGTTASSNRVLGVCTSTGPGQLRVDDVTYTATGVSTLTGSFGIRCEANGNRWVNARLGLAAAVPASSVHPEPVRVPTVGLSKPGSVVATLTNSGTVATGTLGAAALDPAVVGAADFVVGTDSCAGQVLAPDASCTVTLQFQRATPGTSSAVVHVPDAGAEGGRVVVPVSGTAIGAPSAPAGVSAFPVRGGVGVAWAQPEAFLPTAYRVFRLDGASWVDVSGTLPTDARSFGDTTRAPGQSSTYRVVGENVDGAGPPSAEVTGTRLATEPSVGAVDGIDLDGGFAGESPHPLGGDVMATTGLTQGDPVDVFPNRVQRYLQAANVSAVLPRDLPGPGTYPVSFSGTGGTRVLQVSSSAAPISCVTFTGTLSVDQVLFTPTLGLETLAASYDLDCEGRRVTGELRWHSTVPLRAARVGPVVDAGSVSVGTSTAATTVTVNNVGTGPLTVGAPSFTGTAAGDWRVTRNACPATVGTGASCEIDVAATPSQSGARPARLVVPDSTPRQAHEVLLAANGTSLPTVVTGVRAVRVPGGGVELGWDAPQDEGGTGIMGYHLYRTTGGVETTIEPPSAYVQRTFVEPGAPADVSYRLAAYNAVGEGPSSASVTPVLAPDTLVVNGRSGSDLFGAGALALPTSSRVVPLPARTGQSTSVEGFAVSPDGREVLSARPGTASGVVLWRESVSGAGTPSVVFTSAEPVIHRPAWSADGARFAVATGGQQGGTALHIGAVAGGPVVTLDGYANPAWMPDARTVVAERFLAGEPLGLIDGETGQVLTTLPGTEGAMLPTVSPDGRWVAFATLRPFNGSGVYVMPLAGGTPTLVANPNSVIDLAWSTSGSTLVMTLNSFFPSNVRPFLVDIGPDGVPTGEVRDPWADLSISAFATAWVGGRVAIGASPASGSTAPTFAISTAAVSGASVTCAVDDLAPVACSGSFRPTTTVAGTHTLRVRATQTGGRVTTASRSFTIGQGRPSLYRPVAPTRLLDTRTGVGADQGALPANGSVRVKITGLGGVPASGVSAVVLNVTVTSPRASGFVTAHAGGTSRPSASNVNFVAGQTVANLVVVPVGADGTVSLANGSAGSVQLMADVSGYYATTTSSSPGSFGVVAPSRVLDTRLGTGAAKRAVPANGSVRVRVAGVGAVPASGVSAVVLNVTVTSPRAGGFVTAHAGGTPRPGASNLNFVAGQTVPNLVVVPVSADGTVSLDNGSAGSVQLVADVFGYYTSGAPAAVGAFGALAPHRLLDTREGIGAAKRAVPANGSVRVKVTGLGGVPAAGVSAVVLNVTVTSPRAKGYITAYAGGTARPDASNVNFVAGRTVPNLVVVPVGADGTVSLDNVSAGSTQLLADVFGYFRAAD